MNKRNYTNKIFVIDSTAIMHLFPNDSRIIKDCNLIIPNIIKSELKSFKAKAMLEVLESNRNVSYVSPSSGSLKIVKNKAQSSGDLSSLSEADIHVVATALDFPGAHIISDDNAVQNLCSFLNIEVETFIFKIKTRRVYFWKCVGCGTVFKEKLDLCPECGNKLNRFYKKQK